MPYYLFLFLYCLTEVLEANGCFEYSFLLFVIVLVLADEIMHRRVKLTTYLIFRLFEDCRALEYFLVGSRYLMMLNSIMIGDSLQQEDKRMIA